MQTDSDAHPPSSAMGTGGHFSGGKAAEVSEWHIMSN